MKALARHESNGIRTQSSNTISP